MSEFKDDFKRATKPANLVKCLVVSLLMVSYFWILSFMINLW